MEYEPPYTKSRDSLTGGYITTKYFHQFIYLKKPIYTANATTKYLKRDAF